ncbi:MAG: LCP family protein [Lawsonibacter sp.]|nr:LCP family protein [Lawsonibacter sp.]
MSNQNSRHRQSKSTHRPYWRRYRNWLAGLNRGQRVRYRALQAATVISVFIIAGFIVLKAWIRVPDLPGLNSGGNGTAAVGDASFEGAETPDITRSGRKEGVYTFLVVGKDTAGGGNTDTMLLITYDTKAKTLHGLNLPRDTMINVSTNSKRLNAVYNYNKGKDKTTQVEKGIAALKHEVAHLTGITPDFYVIVEWKAIGELVDALGGVEFDVPFDMDYDDPTPGQDLHIHQKAGLRVLNGDDAMQVIRHRKNNDGSHSNGDVGRLKIQQDFLKAVAKKCLQPATFLKAPSLAEIFTENVTTDLTVGNILAFAQMARGMNPDEDVSFNTAPLGGSFLYRGASLVTLDETKLLVALNDAMNPYLRDIQASDLQLLYRNSSGSFGVTNGTLADAKMGQTQTKTTTKPAVEDEKPADSSQTDDADTSQSETGSSGDTTDSQLPDDAGATTTLPEDGQTAQDGDSSADTSQSGSSSQGGDTSQGSAPIGTIDPAQVLPDPNASVSQDGKGTASDTNDSVAVLPSWPKPLGQAA